jgi:DNA adenine methylase
MNPIIKWPGGKSREIDQIYHLLPKFHRYVEPFFGGGALFFHLAPPEAAVNDISEDLMNFYRLVQAQDLELHRCLNRLDKTFQGLIHALTEEADTLYALFDDLISDRLALDQLEPSISMLLSRLGKAGFDGMLIQDPESFYDSLQKNAADKYLRTLKNHKKLPFSREDLLENLITGFAAGYYVYIRKIYNDIALGRAEAPSAGFRAALFYFVREYCYGSMFRYNAHGEFNIPYGGMSYNRKNMSAKISHMFSRETKRVLRGTQLHCLDFEDFCHQIGINQGDFIFLDPPYDTEFSDYEGRPFGKDEQARLAEFLKATPAKFLLIIKNTEYIRSLYEKDFHIHSFDKQYSYNVRSRNQRDVEHLIITNYIL